MLYNIVLVSAIHAFLKFLKFKNFHLNSKCFELSISVVVVTEFFPLPSQHTHIRVYRHPHNHTQLAFLPPKWLSGPIIITHIMPHIIPPDLWDWTRNEHMT